MKRPRSFLVMGMKLALLLGGLPLAAALPNPARGADPSQSPQSQPSQSLSPLEWNRSLMARGRVSERLGQNEDAMADYTLAIESHALPTDEQSRALFDRGLLLDGMSRLDDALADYSASLLLSPSFAAALNNRGNVYRRLGRLADARRDYLAALEVGNPQSQYSYYGLGEIAEAEGSKAEAEEFYARALAADPQYDLARDRMASLSSGEQMVRLEPPAPSPAASATAPPASNQEETGASQITLHPPAPPMRPGLHRASTSQTVGGGRGDPLLRPSLESGPQTAGAAKGTQIQLGAWRSEAEANQGWDHALKQAGDTLKGLSPRIVAVDLPKIGRYYRLRVAAGEEGAQRLCAALAAKGLDCMLVRD